MPFIADPTYNSREWWAAAARHRLLFQRCSRCGTHIFPPRDACPGPDCLAVRAMEWVESRVRGAIYSFTVVHQAADRRFAERVPYVLALIDMDEHFRLWTNITNVPPEDLRIGQRVEVEWYDLGEAQSLPQFRVMRATTEDARDA